MLIGGVGFDNVVDYIEVGVVVVGVGGVFMDDEVIENGDFEVIIEMVCEFLNIIDDVWDD